MEVKIFSIDGKETGKTMVLPAEIFEQEANQQLVHLDVLQYLAANRQGTAKTKERAEIVGSTRKIKRQKGTGTARAGSIKNPLFKGGGTIFGPRPRKYHLTINKKASKIARKSALSDRARNNQIIVVEDFTIETPKTKEIISISNAFGLNNKKKLFLTEGVNKNVYLSSRNLKDTKVLPSKEVNTYAILNASTILITEKAVQELVTVLS